MALLILSPVLLWTLPTRAQTVLCVDSRGTEASPWPQVYTHLQDALAEATLIAEQEPVEIWVAAGVYKPDRGANQTPGDRDASFDLVSNVALYGGFAGGETAREQRNWTFNETILSGDLAGDDDPDAPVTSNCCTDTWELGCDDEVCEAIVIAEESRCAIRWDDTCAYLSNLHCGDLCRPTRGENTYHIVTTVDTDSTVVFDGFTITAGETNGGNIPKSGSGLYSDHASPTVNNCTFVDNAAPSGRALYAVYGEPTVTNCTFTRNASYDTTSGRAMSTRHNEPTIQNCAFIDNRSGGLSTNTSKPIIGCTFIGNSSTGLSLADGSPDIIDCLFVGNRSSSSGAGMYSGGEPRLFNCGFFGNSSGRGGGGLYQNGDSVTLVNCVFSGNTAGGHIHRPGDPPDPGNYGALFANHGSVTVINCTFAGNHAGWVGGLWSEMGPTIINSIFWGNTDARGATEGAQLAYFATSPRISYSSIQGWTPHWWGHDTASIDPLFVDPLGPDGIVGTLDDDLRVSPGSPLINLGDPGFVLEPGATDFAGNPRLRGCRVDIGAYEANIGRTLGDFDGNENVNLADLAGFQACIDASVSNPAWLKPCLCAFDYDDNTDIDLADFANFHKAFVKP